MSALKSYLSQRDLKADWRSVMSAPPETLVNALAMLCPFQPAEKQALVEAPGWPERVDTLVALLEMSVAFESENNTLN
jgi:Lon protease-like protein